MNILNNNKILLEVKALVNSVESMKEDMNIYCELMKQVILRSSGVN